jgi:hypothetical protein
MLNGVDAFLLVAARDDEPHESKKYGGTDRDGT